MITNCNYNLIYLCKKSFLILPKMTIFEDQRLALVGFGAIYNPTKSDTEPSTLPSSCQGHFSRCPFERKYNNSP